MRAPGLKQLEHRDEFSIAREFAKKIAGGQSLQILDSFDRLLVAGVATYSLELLRAVKDHALAYISIGLGSGICGMLAIRYTLNLKTKIVGVASAHASAYAE